MSWRSGKKKEDIFCTVCLNICVSYQCIVYWIHFQNTNTLMYQKTLLHTLFCLFLKSVKSLQCILKGLRSSKTSQIWKQQVLFSFQWENSKENFVLEKLRKCYWKRFKLMREILDEFCAQKETEKPVFWHILRIERRDFFSPQTNFIIPSSKKLDITKNIIQKT